jgi:signal transduction histidine kinase
VKTLLPHSGAELARATAVSARPALASRVLAYLTRQAPRRPVRAAVFISAQVLLIGWLDYITGPHLSLKVFYDIPIALAVAWLGWRAAVGTSVGCVAVWLASEYLAGADYVHRATIWWNLGINLAMFLIVALVLDAFISLHRQMEARVRQRTDELHRAVVMRERLQRELLRIGERERSSIGRDLHDGLCQHLAGTAMAAQVLAGRLDGRERAAAAEARGIVRLVEEGIAQTRTLANGLLLASIPPEHLVPELEKLAEAVTASQGVACRLTVRGDPRVADETMASNLYRIAQEAVRNAVRHAKASRLEIVLQQDGPDLTLTVSDNGPGLPRRRRGPGMGLRIMAHRAEILRGEFAVETPQGGGTSVRCRVPTSAG